MARGGSKPRGKKAAPASGAQRGGRLRRRRSARRALHTQEAGAWPHFLSLPEGRSKQATSVGVSLLHAKLKGAFSMELLF